MGYASPLHGMILLGIVAILLLWAFGKLPPSHARQLGRGARELGSGVGQIVKMVILLPLLVIGGLVLAWVVLFASYRFTSLDDSRQVVEGSGQIVVEGSTAAIVDLSRDDATSELAQSGHVPPPAPLPARQHVAKNNPSGIVRMLRAVSASFASAAKSVAPKELSSGGTWARTTERIFGTAAAEAKPSAFAEVAKAGATTAEPKPPAAAPAASSPAAPPAAPKRPAWVDHPPQPSGEPYEVAVNSEPWKTRFECEKALIDQIDLAVDDYVAWRIGEEARSQVRLPEDFVRHQLVAEEPWLEKVDTKFGEQMYNLHALLRFDPQVDRKVREAWSQVLVTGRLVGSGAILGGALLLLAVIYGYLKLSLAACRRKSQSGAQSAA